MLKGSQAAATAVNAWSTWLLRLLIAVGTVFVWLAIWSQPSAADDWYVGWQLADAGSAWTFLKQMYLGWSGRMFTMALASVVLSSVTAISIFKLSILPCFVVLAACAHYLATGKAPRFDSPEERGFLLTAAVLWLGIPVASETIVQVTGACAYLFPAAAGFGFLALLHRIRIAAQNGPVESDGAMLCTGLFVLGVIVGTANEQLFAGMAVLLAGWGWLLLRDGKLKHVPSEVWWGLAGLLLGTLILVAAPGNYVRMGAQTEGTDRLLTVAARFAMYLGGAYFGLGTADTGRALWLGLAVLILGGSFTASGQRGKDALIYMAASLATLAPMILLVNFASPRTSFFAVIFLVIAARTAAPNKPADMANATPLRLVALGLALLVVIDGFVGWAANRSLNSEEAARFALIQQAVAKGENEAVVPYLATIPSRLTFMLNPEHDKLFVLNMSRRQGLSGGRHDDTPGTPRPHTVNTLKKLKNLL
jgi:hypothetical protein